MNTQQSQLSFTERYFANDPSIDVLAAFTTDSATQEEVENEAMYIQRNGHFIFEQAMPVMNVWAKMNQENVTRKIFEYQTMTCEPVSPIGEIRMRQLWSNICGKITWRLQSNLVKTKARTATFNGVSMQTMKQLEFACPLPTRLHYHTLSMTGEDGPVKLTLQKLVYKHNLPFDTECDDRGCVWHRKLVFDSKMKRWRLFEVTSLEFDYNIWKEQLSVRVSYKMWARFPAGMLRNVNVTHWKEI